MKMLQIFFLIMIIIFTENIGFTKNNFKNNLWDWTVETDMLSKNKQQEKFYDNSKEQFEPILSENTKSETDYESDYIVKINSDNSGKTVIYNKEQIIDIIKNVKNKELLVAALKSEIDTKNEFISDLNVKLNKYKENADKYDNVSVINNDSVKSSINTDFRLHFSKSIVYFGSGDTEIHTKYYNLLSEINEKMVADKKLHLIVIGHTDNVPISEKSYIESNWLLSYYRALEIKKYLTDNFNIKPYRIHTFFYGAMQPVRSNQKEEYRKFNRRVELYFAYF